MPIVFGYFRGFAGLSSTLDRRQYSDGSPLHRGPLLSHSKGRRVLSSSPLRPPTSQCLSPTALPSAAAGQAHSRSRCASFLPPSLPPFLARQPRAPVLPRSAGVLIPSLDGGRHRRGVEICTGSRCFVPVVLSFSFWLVVRYALRCGIFPLGCCERWNPTAFFCQLLTNGSISPVCYGFGLLCCVSVII